jgi:DNA gyrase inhibitor GyrI
VTLFATNGKELRQYGVTNQTAGSHTLSISMKEIPAGLYAVQVKAAGKVQSLLICKQ